jgi:hypothetical protein
VKRIGMVITALALAGCSSGTPATGDSAPAKEGGGDAAAASCTDKAKNGDETDVDCGGSCPACGEGKVCAVPKDCLSSVCSKNICVAPPATCTDKVKNGDETDIDCGGSCPACGEGKSCALPKDCVSNVCSKNICVVPPASCTDKVQNGTETDVDCGGSCPPCATGKACLSGADCAFNLCGTKKTCECPCKNPLDECAVPGMELVCRRAGYTCNSLQPCETPAYSCESGSCVCKDIETCGVTCATSCPRCTTCDPDVCGTGGICRWPLGCLTDGGCGTGELCIANYMHSTFVSPPPAYPHQCAKPGSKTVGSPCTAGKNAECASGVCDGICLQRCRSNQDCGSLLCSTTPTSYGQLGCVASSGCSSCTGPTQWCSSSVCKARGCESGADCPTGDCQLGTIYYSSGTCGAPPKKCQDDEFTLSFDSAFCYKPKPCWLTADCPSGYTCKWTSDGSFCAKKP